MQILTWLHNWLVKANWLIYASIYWAIIGTDNGLSPVRSQAIIWRNTDLMLAGSGLNIHTFKEENAMENAAGKMAAMLSGLSVFCCYSLGDTELI